MELKVSRKVSMDARLDDDLMGAWKDVIYLGNFYLIFTPRNVRCEWKLVVEENGKGSL